MLKRGGSCSDTLQQLFNDVLKHDNFPDKLKYADVKSVFKKNDPTKAKNYRPVSVLPGFSKIFERLMHNQISFYIDQSLSLTYVAIERVSVLITHFCLLLKNGKWY